MTHRRQFLRTSTRLAAGLGLSSLGAPHCSAAQREPLFTISLAEWSLNRALFGGKLDHLDFSKTAKHDFEIEAVEYVNQFFKDKANDRGYLGEMKHRAADLGVRSLLIMIDNEGDLGDANEAK